MDIVMVIDVSGDPHAHAELKIMDYQIGSAAAEKARLDLEIEDDGVPHTVGRTYRWILTKYLVPVPGSLD
jgi:hypothetical protein